MDAAEHTRAGTGAETAWPLHTVIDGTAALLEEPYVVLPDGRRGWWMRAKRDCFRAAAATLAQVPYEELDGIATVGELEEWAAGRGLAVRLWPGALGPPVQWDWWLGVFTVADCPNPADVGESHTFVGSYGEVAHDPACGMEFANGWRAPVTTDAELRSIDLALRLEEAAC